MDAHYNKWIESFVFSARDNCWISRKGRRFAPAQPLPKIRNPAAPPPTAAAASRPHARARLPPPRQRPPPAPAPAPALAGRPHPQAAAAAPRRQNPSHRAAPKCSTSSSPPPPAVPSPATPRGAAG
ncbi:hypothetical protein BS78_K058300 [Paspalum vaginatum]|uniref:Uncharacterized protein n=1 Tax=Paspalum vaginatum TaxID=158149 RepID=A0A9W7X8P5_9POAL|nr:hypothetical protein BS78_K058300 [Paspalum vaginatum]